MKKKLEDVYYYTNELEDEFSPSKLSTKVIDKDYRYLDRNKFSYFFWNRVFAKPVCLISAKLKFHWKIVGREKFKLAKDTGYFIYGNHTQDFFDATMPKMISPKDAHVIINPDNLNIKGIGWMIKRLGALPLPSDVASTKNFVSAIDQLIGKKKPILIYPEAHIWPYYTKIRPFKTTSFRYPVKCNVPAFAFTNTYVKRKHGNKPKIITYVDGPFYPNEELPLKEREQDLRDRVYNAMVERSKLSNFEKIKYIKKVGENND